MKTYKAIFFDWDGTLVHHSFLIAEGHNYVRKNFGLDDYNKNDAISRGHQSTRELYPILYGDRAKEAEKLFYEFFFDNHLSDVNPFDDTATLLELIKTTGLKAGVVSNKGDHFLKREITHIGYDHYFDSIVGAGVAEKDKPSSAPLKLALEMTDKNLTAQDILYVGDTETDLKCAQDMGCDCVLTTRGRDMTDFINKYKPTYVSNGFEDLIKTLELTNKENPEKKAC